MKKGNKKSSNYIDIPMNVFCKVLVIVQTIIIAVLSLAITLTYIIPSFSNPFWFYIRNPINDFFFYIFESFPFITNHYLIILITLIIISASVIIFLNYLNVPKKKRKKIEGITNIFYEILSVLIFFILIEILITLSDYNHANINTFYLNDYSNKEYNKDDIFNLLEDLKYIILDESKLFLRYDGEIIEEKESLELQARKDLENIARPYPFLRGLYPNKIKDIKDNIDSYGYTNNYSISTYKEVNNVNYMSVITHEYCHFKGILHESDAIYCSYLAGINSDNLLSKYAAHLEAFSWVMNVASKIDEVKTQKLVEEILNLCLNDNYREVCDIQIKNVNQYQENSNVIIIESYMLYNYYERIDEFIDILDIYLNQYNASMTINDREVDLIDIRNIIINGSADILIIKLNNNSDAFIEVKELLLNSSRYFKSIKQQNNTYQYEDDIDYYINPFTRNTISLMFETELYNNYGYPRVVRLLLEHRNKYGIK